MTGAGAAWDALFDRLGIIATASMSEFLETLKLVDSGHLPRGRRVLVTAASGVMGIMLADHLSAAGFEMPQPSDQIAGRMRPLLPAIATPANPMDVTMAAWNDRAGQVAFQSILMEQGYDIAILVQNYPPEDAWDIAEYAAQLEALAEAAAGRNMALIQLSPLVEGLPAAARAQTRKAGMVPMQGLVECIAALGHVQHWQDRLAAIRAEGAAGLILPRTDPAKGQTLDEAAAKSRLAALGVPVPKNRTCTPAEAPGIAAALGFPVALKALDPDLLHKSEAGGVRLNLRSQADVSQAVAAMQAACPTPQVLVERMAPAAMAEVMASVTTDPAVGRVMMLAGGGVQAELWSDQVLIAAPFTQAEIARALARLKTSALIDGYRGRPAGDRAALITALLALACVDGDVEVNPILVHEQGVTAVDAVMRLP
jgi:acetate---CoA ligase (ADP-forming)